MSGSLRTNVGKKDAKAIRKDGNVPCVLYGGKEQLQFFVSNKSFKDVIFTPEICYLHLNIEGKEFKAIMKDVQYHPTTDEILHVDMLELVDGKPIVMGVPIKITGVAPGVLRGGKLIQKVRKLKIKALPEHMPDIINIDISKLDIGDTIKVSNLLQENLSFLDSRNAMVVSVQVTRVVEEAKPGDAAAGAEAAAKDEKEKAS